MRLLVLTEIPAPFRIPGLNALAATPDLEVHVVVVAEHDPRRRYEVDPSRFGFAYHVLRGPSLQARGRWLALSFGFARIVRSVRPDVIVVGGWNQPVFWQALFAARRRGIPAALWVESTARDARSGRHAADRLRRTALRRASGFLVPGRASAEFLRELGVADHRIRTAPNAIEPGVVGTSVSRDETRTELGVDGCVFLYVGRLEREKGPDVLVRAMHQSPGTLVIVGDGSLRAELERLAPEGRVIFAGHAQRNELARWYAAADVFVLPSRSDVWAMVLNEAAAAGLPLVASEVAGAAYDLIEPGVNGHLIPSDDPDALAAVLRQVESDAAWRAAAGHRSQQLARRFTPDAWASEVATLARSLLVEPAGGETR